jgi:hypothetical protein
MDELTTSNLPTAANEASDAPSQPMARYGRRALMLGAAGAGAGIAVGLVAGAAPAGAANGNPVELGETNSATTETVINTTSEDGLQANTAGDSGSHGVKGTATNGTGVYGSSSGGTGVEGQASTNGQSGVAGIDTSPGGGHGTYGNSTNGIGAYGEGHPVGVYGAGNVGVYGTGNYGVVGSSPDQAESSAFPFLEGDVGMFGITGTGGPNISTISAGVEGFDVNIDTPACGVFGNSLLAIGVQGHGPVAGVIGMTANFEDLDTLNLPHSYGVYGVDNNFETNQATGPTYAIYGASDEGTGAYGTTAADGQSGMQGGDTSKTGGIGVQGSSTAGIGVSGSSSTGVAVEAIITNGANSSPAVSASTNGTGPAVLASNAGGTALEVDGVASFSRSGLATVAGTSSAAKSSIVVTGVSLSASSLVLATPQGQGRRRRRRRRRDRHSRQLRSRSISPRPSRSHLRSPGSLSDRALPARWGTVPKGTPCGTTRPGR